MGRHAPGAAGRSAGSAAGQSLRLPAAQSVRPPALRSLRSKLDGSKASTFLAELLVYCMHVSPLLSSREEIENKILYLCVDKYQHTKIKSSCPSYAQKARPPTL